MKLLFHGIGLYREHQLYGPAKWPHPDLFVLREGQIVFNTPKGSLDLHQGDAVWIPPGLRFHGHIESERAAFWVLHFRGKLDVTDFTSEFAGGVGLFRGGTGSDLAQGLMSRLHQLYLGHSKWPPLAEHLLPALLTEISRNSRAPHSHDDWGHDLEQWARDHLAEGIGVRELAQQAALSESHFRKLFTARRGYSPGRFLHDLRLDEARHLLQQTTLSLKEIGDHVGYGDAVAFHRAFTDTFQITPTNFRKQRILKV